MHVSGVRNNTITVCVQQYKTIMYVSIDRFFFSQVSGSDFADRLQVVDVCNSNQKTSADEDKDKS